MVHDHDLLTTKNFGPIADNLVALIKKLIAEGERREEEKNAKAKAEHALYLQEKAKKAAEMLLNKSQEKTKVTELKLVQE